MICKKFSGKDIRLYSDEAIENRRMFLLALFDLATCVSDWNNFATTSLLELEISILIEVNLRCWFFKFKFGINKDSRQPFFVRWVRKSSMTNQKKENGFDLHMLWSEKSHQNAWELSQSIRRNIWRVPLNNQSILNRTSVCKYVRRRIFKYSFAFYRKSRSTIYFYSLPDTCYQIVFGIDTTSCCQ